MPRRGSASWSVTQSASTLDFSRKLRNPGPAISGGSQRSDTSSLATISVATSRGERPSDLASRSATLDWK